jgi:predicted DNA-binding transcriptional regulator AlpA
MTVFDERFMTVQELAGFLGISPTSVYNRLQEWPHMRTTAKGIIRFREAHVEQILESMTKKPAPPSIRPNVGTRANRRKQ